MKKKKSSRWGALALVFLTAATLFSKEGDLYVKQVCAAPAVNTALDASLKGGGADSKGFDSYNYNGGRQNAANGGVGEEYSLDISSNVTLSSVEGTYSELYEDHPSWEHVIQCFETDTNQKGAVSALWKNAATMGYGSDKVKLDIRAVVTNWKESSQGDVHYFYFGKVGTEGEVRVYLKNLEWIKVRYEFYKAGTNQKVEVKGLINDYDIDDKQFVGLIDYEKIWVNSTGTNLQHSKQTYNSVYDVFYNPNDTGQAASDVENMISSTFTGTDLYRVYGTPELISGPDKFILSSKRYIYTKAQIEKPEKTVSDSDEKNVKKNTISSRLEEWTYQISQTILREEMEQNYYDSFQFEDEIDSCLNIASVKILNTAGSDVSSHFTIAQTGGKVTAKAQTSFVKSKDFYDETYTMQIRVKVKKDAPLLTHSNDGKAEKGHYNSAMTSLHFLNEAKTLITEGGNSHNQQTQETETVLELPGKTEGGDPGLSITKSVKQYEWQVKDMAAYTVKVKNNHEKSQATDIVISDKSLPATMKLQKDSVKVSGIDSSNYTLSVEGNSWILRTKEGFALPQTSTITITFQAQALTPSNGTCVPNTAAASAWSVPESKGSQEVYINSPKLLTKKSALDKAYKRGDQVTYTVNVVNVNPGTVMSDIVLDDRFQTEGIRLVPGTLTVTAEGKDRTADCDITCTSNSYHIKTPLDLKNGTLPCLGKNKPQYDGMSLVDQVVVTYEAIIESDQLAGENIENVVVTPPTENVNGDRIKEDESIPSGGSSSEESIKMKSPVLQILKSSDKKAYQVGETGTYILKVTQNKEDLIAKNVVIKDEFEQDGIEILDLTVLYNGSDITQSCKIGKENQNIKIETGRNLGEDDELVIRYQVKFLEAVENLKNTAAAKGDNTKEDEDQCIVTVSQKPDATDKKPADNKTGSDSGTQGKTQQGKKKSSDTIATTAKRTVTRTGSSAGGKSLSSGSSAVKTGDQNPILLLVFLGTAAAGGIVILVFLKGIRYNKKKR